jgi:hypothetical protein
MFLHVHFRRPEGHFLGDALIRAVREPAAVRGEFGPGLLRALTEDPGAPLRDRLRGASGQMAPIASTRVAGLRMSDPLERAKRKLGPRTAAPLEEQAREEMASAVAAALTGAGAATCPA